MPRRTQQVVSESSESENAIERIKSGGKEKGKRKGRDRTPPGKVWGTNLSHQGIDTPPLRSALKSVTATFEEIRPDQVSIDTVDRVDQEVSDSLAEHQLHVLEKHLPYRVVDITNIGILPHGNHELRRVPPSLRRVHRFPGTYFAWYGVADTTTVKYQQTTNSGVNTVDNTASSHINELCTSQYPQNVSFQLPSVFPCPPPPPHSTGTISADSWTAVNVGGSNPKGLKCVVPPFNLGQAHAILAAPPKPRAAKQIAPLAPPQLARPERCAGIPLAWDPATFWETYPFHIHSLNTTHPAIYDLLLLEPPATPRARSKDWSKPLLTRHICYGSRDSSAGILNKVITAAVPINAEMDGQYIEPLDGSITDGDDHAWSGNPAILGGNGGWQEFDFSTTSLLGKRGRSRGSSEASDNTLEEEEVRRQFFPAFGGDESDDEEERQKNKEHILKRAKDLRRAAEILEAQAEAGNAIWMASIVRRNIGNDKCRAKENKAVSGGRFNIYQQKDSPRIINWALMLLNVARLGGESIREKSNLIEFYGQSESAAKCRQVPPWRQLAAVWRQFTFSDGGNVADSKLFLAAVGVTGGSVGGRGGRQYGRQSILRAAGWAAVSSVTWRQCDTGGGNLPKWRQFVGGR
ncbi:hypothetical protein DFH07DRAFT_774433 [Mycena maculata]|uniref:Uncharacterized protein n=1 Tax=Mycena maculata TaxID=230809 RepID=A0AAD7N9J7_9AGAR|nr:hypothetical protein DFH07DRAFT_774433 [Mycena maculata]